MLVTKTGCPAVPRWLWEILMGVRLAGTHPAAVVTHQRTHHSYLFPKLYNYPCLPYLMLYHSQSMGTMQLYWTDNNFGFWNVLAPLCSSGFFHLWVIPSTFWIPSSLHLSVSDILLKDYGSPKKRLFLCFFLLPQLGDKPPPPPLGLHCLASLAKSDENVMKSTPLPPSCWWNNWSRGFTYKCKIAQNYKHLKKH